MPDPVVAPSTAQVPPAAAPETQQPDTKVVPPAVTPPVVPPAVPEVKKEGAAAEPAPATKVETPAVQPTVLVKAEDLKLPEGSLLDPKVIEEIVSLANEKKLSKELAQGMLERESKIVSSYVEGEKAKATQMQDSWYEACKADKEIGGAAFEENVELGHRVVKTFGTEAFEKVLKDSGAYEHPEVVRFMVRLGKAMAPGQLVVVGADAGNAKLPRLADRLYGAPPAEAAAPAE